MFTSSLSRGLETRTWHNLKTVSAKFGPLPTSIPRHTQTQTIHTKYILEQMGCGSSVQQGAERHDHETQTHKVVEVGSPYNHQEFIITDEQNVALHASCDFSQPATVEEHQLLADLKQMSPESETGSVRSEPGATSKAARNLYRCLKARVKHGITDDADQFEAMRPPEHEIQRSVATCEAWLDELADEFDALNDSRTIADRLMMMSGTDASSHRMATARQSFASSSAAAAAHRRPSTTVLASSDDSGLGSRYGSFVQQQQHQQYPHTPLSPPSPQCHRAPLVVPTSPMSAEAASRIGGLLAPSASASKRTTSSADLANISPSAPAMYLAAPMTTSSAVGFLKRSSDVGAPRPWLSHLVLRDHDALFQTLRGSHHHRRPPMPATSYADNYDADEW